MKCLEIRELFSPYIDNEISPAEKKLVEGHLACCPSCAEELAQWQKMSGLLRDLGSMEIDVPSELRENVMARINASNRATAGKPKGKIASLAGISRYKRLVAAAASIMILGFGYWGFAGDGDGITKPSTEIAEKGSGEKRTPAETPQKEEPLQEEQTESAGDVSEPTVEEPGTVVGEEDNRPGVSPQEDPANDSSTVVTPPNPDRTEPVQDNNPVAMLNVEKKSLTASLQLAVVEKEAACAIVTGLAEQYQADYSQQPLEQAVLIQLKVSNKDFPAIVANLERLGEIRDKKIQEKDLTPQYKELSAELQELEEQKKTLSDPAAVKKLNADIEALRVKLAHLDQQADNAFIAVWIE